LKSVRFVATLPKPEDHFVHGLREVHTDFEADGRAHRFAFVVGTLVAEGVDQVDVGLSLVVQRLAGHPGLLRREAVVQRIDRVDVEVLRELRQRARVRVYVAADTVVQE